MMFTVHLCYWLGGAQRPPPTGILMNLDANIKKSGGILSRRDFVTGGFCRGGILSGDFVAGGFCPGVFCHGALLAVKTCD